MKAVVKYDELEELTKKIEKSIEEYNKSITRFKDMATNNSDIWESKYQKTFEKYINNELYPYLKKIADKCERTNKFILQESAKYKKLDQVRKNV